MLYSGKDLRKLIIPLVIEQVLAIAVGMADTIMVSAAGEAAVSGVSLVDTVNILLINVFSALATGGAVVAGHFLGQKKRAEACRTAWQILLFATILAVAISAVFLAAHDPLLRLIFGKTDEAVMRASKTYLIITAWSFPALAIYNSCAALFRAMNGAKVTMWVSLLMNGLNVIGNAICMFGLHMGVEGVALPTTVSRYVAAVVIFIMMFYGERQISLRGQVTLRFEGKLIKRILYIAVPNGLENSMFQLGKIMVLSLVSGFGTASIAANAVSNSVCAFAILGGMSMGYALSSVSAQCVGAGDYKQVRYYTKKLMGYSYASMLAMNLLIIAALSFIIKVYNLSPETGKMAEEIILYHAVCSVLIWPVAFTLPNTLRAANDVGFCMIVSVVSMWIFRIGLSFVLSKNLGMGVLGVWVAMTIDWVVRAIFFAFRYRGTKWQKAKA